MVHTSALVFPPNRVQTIPLVRLALAAAFTDPANVDRLQQSLTMEIEKRVNARQTNPDEAQKRVNSLQTKLRSVERRLAEVDSDMLEIIQDRIRELRKDIRKAEAQLSAACAAAGILGPEEIQAKQEQVIELLAKLPRTLSKLSAADQNRVLSELVERVDVKVNVLPPIQPKLHTRPRYELAGGVVFLASAIALNLFMPEMSTVVHNAAAPASILVVSDRHRMQEGRRGNSANTPRFGSWAAPAAVWRCPRG